MKVLNIHEVDDVRLDDYELPERGPKDVVVKMKAVRHLRQRPVLHQMGRHHARSRAG